jgi:heme exporter protein D
MLHLDMAKYAVFVWPAWGLSLLVLGALTIWTLRAARYWKAEADRAKDVFK